MHTVRSLTAAICTYGQAPHLMHALESLAHQEVPTGLSFEIVCVDNNPQPAVRLPDSLAETVRLLHEREPGLSCARNAAIGHSSSDVVAFVDDDAVASPGWLAETVRAFDQTGVWCVGGRVLPQWPDARPDWLHPALDYLLSLFDLGDEPARLTGRVLPCGTNLAIRRTAFAQVGDFEARLGRKPDSLLSGEETLLFRRVLRAGGVVAYVPRALVYHIVPASRLKPDYLRLRAWWEGRTQALVDRLMVGTARTAGNALARAILALVREPPVYVSGLRDSRKRELSLCRLHKMSGYWAGLRGWPAEG